MIKKNDITFQFNVLCQRTKWGEGDSTYTELVYITTDELASFIIYYYHNDLDKVVIRNLYVDENNREKGIASSIIKSIQQYCKKNNKDLCLWCHKDSWLYDWYKRIGFQNMVVNDENTTWMIDKCNAKQKNI
jgi:N-acetylglutamate synthase-like GNAT family acetyltransferase